MTERVGIVVRTRQRPDFLRRALADIGAQSFRDFRVVVVNDGGDAAEVDGVVDASGLDAVAVHRIAPGDGGRCVAANVGVRDAGTEYVVLHDDDDRWHPDFLSRTVAWLDAHPSDAAVAVPTEIVYEEQRGGAWTEVGRAPFWAGMQRISLTEMLSVNRAVPISVLYRRAVHDEVGWYDETLDAVEDWDLYLRILRAGEIGFLPGEALAYWTQRPDATGLDANSMFALTAEHAADDARVRDRALHEWVRREGTGLPLYLASLHAELLTHIDETVERAVHRLRAEIAADNRIEIDAHQPLWSRVRRLRRLLGRRSGRA
ncbi:MULTISPECIES: glycosyltransferase family 2 protein [Microbacterium]|uniref:glycosyltransferase family 2 protein n=1 Tax=Microbacterium TaxID=33882 RepID=UPI00278646DC|nr:MULTISPECIES: glycosyltransferase family A protein [Microbacterium]MDQ1083248.1 glycosyltransferase involved in cell wall biosynthesis [Microbacterium sp. SORGH_AS_0344]MDQ1171474.1 glycosyltransferase involved in cell wall biosynthesis [Microbacterium proteolyticum]